MIRLSADLHRFSEGRGTSWKEHELLECELVSGMGATINDVESRGRENEWRFDASEIGKMLVERNALFGCGCLCYSDRNTKDGIGA